MRNTAQQCRLVLFQDSDFAGDLEDSKSTSEGVLCIFGSHMFVPISWMSKKQTSVSHSSPEAEIISLDAGLRMDGIPALTLQMIAAKILDIISRLPGCAGQAADAVSAYTQVKIEDAHKLLKIPKSECPDMWIRLPRHKWPKSWSSMEDPVVPLERNLYGHPLAGLLWERQFEKILMKHGWEKVSKLGMLIRTS